VSGSVAGVRVLVTGGTSGIGRAMAVALVREGARVLVGARDLDRGRALEAELVGCPGQIRAVRIDVRDEASCAAAVETARSWLSGLDVLVNNAGLGMRFVNARFLTEPAPFWTVPPERFRAVVDTNLTGLATAK
jgi:NAD(P)-dependent dehydrogenase (short-subunit alcohol dehydrogenase family)